MKRTAPGHWRHFISLGLVLFIVGCRTENTLSTSPEEEARLVQAAERLLPLLDLNRREMRRVRRLAERGNKAEALRVWRDLLVNRMRKRNYNHFYQHDYSLHWRQVGMVDMLTGIVSKEDYLADASRTGFLDIFDMAGPPNRNHRIHWFAQPEDVKDWGNPEINGWSLAKKRSAIGYGCFHFGRSFVARYWETGTPAYREKCMNIMDDFVINHYRMFWDAYRRGEVHTRNRDVGHLYYTDWRENVNALDTAVRARNFVVFQAGLAKCLGKEKPANWDVILHPLTARLSRAEMEALPADQMADIAISLIENHSAKVIRFVSGSCVPNQRLTALKTLLCLAATYPNFRHIPELEKVFRINMDKVLSDNYLPDGGSLEQSFNYNHGELRELQVILSMFGDHVPPFAETLKERVEARQAMDDGLRTPLGGLPQVGNHSSFTTRGKDIWSSPEALAKYVSLCQEKGLQPKAAPQNYLSKGYPYSGYYAMRGGWEITDPYLFFMNGRPQSGHSMHDANSIQITAYGRNLVVCDGAPTYGYRHTPEAEIADFAVSEQCGWKVNTVLVDGMCQARDTTCYSHAPQTPVPCRWHTSDTFDAIENVCDRGYWQAQEPHGKPDHSVTHRRTVIFLRNAGFWLVEDRMHRKDDKVHTYAQVWNFPPKIESEKDYWRQHIDGFTPDQFELQPDRKRFTTVDPNGPNIEFIHITPGDLNYRKYYADEKEQKGWFAPGLGSVCAAPDVHAEWQSPDSDVMATLLLPRPKSGLSPIMSINRISDERTFGVDCELRNGQTLSCRFAKVACELRSGNTTVTDATLLVILDPRKTGQTVRGIVAGTGTLSLGGETVPINDGFAEFAGMPEAKPQITPVPVQRSPVIAEHPPFLASEPIPEVQISGEEGYEIHYTLDGAAPVATSPMYTGPLSLTEPATVKACYAQAGKVGDFVTRREYRPVFYPPRQADFPLSEAMSNGLHCAEILHPPGCRLYDLMLQKPERTFERTTWKLEDYAKRTNYGLKQTCLIRIPKGGFWRFHLKRGDTATAGIVIRNPRNDLRIGPITSVGWWAEEKSGSIALEAGYHCLEIQYGCFYDPRNGLMIEIEGPDTPRQKLPDSWLFLDPGRKP